MYEQFPQPTRRRILRTGININRRCPKCEIDNKTVHMVFNQSVGKVFEDKAQLMTTCPECGHNWELTLTLNQPEEMTGK